MDHSFTTDMSNAIIRNAIMTTTTEMMESDVEFENTADFWYAVSQKLEKDSKIIRTGANVQRVYRAARETNRDLPNDHTFVKKALQAAEKALDASKQAHDKERAGLYYPTIQEANKPVIQQARAAKALEAKLEA